MFTENHPTDSQTHELAIRIARRCRFIIEAVLRENEWADADNAFYKIVRQELEAARSAGLRPTPAPVNRSWQITCPNQALETNQRGT